MKTKKNKMIRWIIASTLFGGALFYSSCDKDQGPLVVVPKVAPISYSGAIQPIFTAHCVKCHPPVKSLDLTLGKSYNSLVNGGYLNTATPTSSILYLSITTSNESGGLMPKGAAPLSSDTANMILTWIQQGALNN